MSAEMKASVLLTLGVQGEKDVKAASNALKDLATSAKGVQGSGGMGTAAKDAELLSKSAAKAATATAEVASAAKGIGSGYASAAKDADALAAAASRAATASAKAATAAKATGSGKDTILYGSAARENAAKSGTPLMAVKGNDFEKSKAIANNLDRANPTLYAGPKGAALLDQHVKDEMDRLKGAGGGKSLGSKAMDAWFTVMMGKMAVGAVDHIIEKSAVVSAQRERLKFSLGGGEKGKAGADAAYAKAKELSAKYKNTSVTENLHIIDDLRANLPEHFDEILAHSTEPFVKLHSFFKGWAGGKHAGNAEKALEKIGAAIRSGELMGNLTGEQIAQHAEAVATSQIVFGDKFDMKQYLQGVQKGATALAAGDDHFKYVDFPILTQALGAGGAVALRGLFDKVGAGNKVASQSAEAWRELGLVDMSQVETAKNGKIKGASLLGKDWLFNQEKYRNNLPDAIMEHIVPALAAKGGLSDLKGLDAAWKAGDVDAATKILVNLRKDPANLGRLAKWAAALAKDPKAGQALEEFILRSSDELLKRNQYDQLRNVDKTGFKSYDKSKQEVGAQADRLLQVVSGEDFSGNVGAAWRGLAAALGTAAGDVAKFKQSVMDGSILGAGKAVIQGLAHVIAPPVKPGEDQDWGLAGKAGKWIKDKWYGTAADDGPMGPPDPHEPLWKRAARYQPDDKPSKFDRLAAGPAVPTLVGGAMADGAAAPEGVTIQANGPQVSFNQAPPNITTNVTVNVTTNASPGEIGAAVGSAVSGAASRSGALHDGAY